MCPRSRPASLPFLGFALVCAAAAPTRLVADFAADLARVSVEAAGGVSAHEALRGLRAVGVTRVGEGEVNFILHAERPDRLRIETLGATTSLVRASDGVRAPWKKTDPLRPPRRLGTAEEREFLVDAEFDQPLFDHARRGIGLDYAGRVEIEGKSFHRLLAVIRHTELVTLYLDEETRLLVRRDQSRRVQGREIVIETHYEDFRPVAGVLLPHRILTRSEGRVLTDTRIESLDANPALPADFFAPPVADWPAR